MRGALVFAIVLALVLAGCSGPVEPADDSPGQQPGTQDGDGGAGNGDDATGSNGAPGASTLFRLRFSFPVPGAADLTAAWDGGGVALRDLTTDRTLEFWATGPGGIRIMRVVDGDLEDLSEGGGIACDCRALGVMPAGIDNDDDADAFVAVGGAPSRIYRLDGSAFTRLQSPMDHPPLPVDVTTAAWLELDNDGLLDLVLFRAGGEALALRNLNGTFEQAPEALWPAGAQGAKAAALIDLDDDSFLDVVVVRDDGFSAMRNRNGSYVPFAGFVGNQTGRVALAADFQVDGLQDLFLAGASGPIVLANHRGRELRAVEVGLPSDPLLTATAVDADLDGFVDIVLAPAAGGLHLYRNTNEGRAFEAVAADSSGLPAMQRYLGLALGDANDDGRPDLLASRADGVVELFGHAGTSGRFFKVGPSGIQSNRDGVGVLAVAVTGTFLQEQYVETGASLHATKAPQAIFGLGEGGIATLRLKWPSGTFQDQSIPANESFDRILWASEEASLSTWGDGSC